MSLFLRSVVVLILAITPAILPAATHGGESAELVPESASLLLAGLGFLGVGFAVRQRRSR